MKTINQLKFPYFAIFILTHMNGKNNQFVLFDFQELNKEQRSPDEYQMECYLTAEEIGQFMGGN